MMCYYEVMNVFPLAVALTDCLVEAFVYYSNISLVVSCVNCFSLQILVKVIIMQY